MEPKKIIVLRRNEQILTMLFHGKRPVTVQACDETAKTLVGNIYVGRVQNIVANIEAAFVEIQKGLLCYLPFSEVKQPIFTNRNFSGRQENSDVPCNSLRVGDELLVQVTRDALKTKQPALTTKLSFPGNYLVLSTGNPHLGISGKLSASQKQEIRTFLRENALIDEDGSVSGTALPFSNNGSTLNIPYGMVVRTNAACLSDNMTDMAEEWQSLTQAFQRFISVAMCRPCYTCLKSGLPGYLETIKNTYQDEYDEILTDDPEIYQTIQDFLQTQMQMPAASLRLYQDTQLSLSALYSIETRLKEALSPRVWLKSGGYLIIEPTEALTVIDVNTGKYDAKKGSLEDTVNRINLEAAEEIAAQIRLRNLSGIIIIDFINMETEEHRTELLKTLWRLAAVDPVKTGVIDITPLGLVEMTRKKVNKSLREQLHSEKVI